MKTAIEKVIEGLLVRVAYDEDKFRLYLDGREAAFGYVLCGVRLEVVDGVWPAGIGITKFIEDNAVFAEPAVVEQELAATEAEEEEQEDGVAC